MNETENPTTSTRLVHRYDDVPLMLAKPVGPVRSAIPLGLWLIGVYEPE